MSLCFDYKQGRQARHYELYRDLLVPLGGRDPALNLQTIRNKHTGCSSVP